MSKTVTDQHVVGGGVFLVDALAQSVFTELLLTIKAVINCGTIRSSTEEIFHCSQIC